MIRWNWRVNEDGENPEVPREAFLVECVRFLHHGMENKSWTYWVANDEKEIISQVFVQKIRKVPKPGRVRDEYGYVTNVYTVPQYRGRGIGSQLMRSVIAWGSDEDLEFLIVWPSEESLTFYRGVGFTTGAESVMEYVYR